MGVFSYCGAAESMDCDVCCGAVGGAACGVYEVEAVGMVCEGYCKAAGSSTGGVDDCTADCVVAGELACHWANCATYVPHSGQKFTFPIFVPQFGQNTIFTSQMFVVLSYSNMYALNPQYGDLFLQKEFY